MLMASLLAGLKVLDHGLKRPWVVTKLIDRTAWYFLYIFVPDSPLLQERVGAVTEGEPPGQR